MLELAALRAGLTASKPLIAVGCALVLLAIAGLGFWRGVVEIRRIADSAAVAARAERDAHWRAEIAQANTEAMQRRAAQAAAAAKQETESRAEIARLTQHLSELERVNATLPDGDRRGVARDRVRLLR